MHGITDIVQWVGDRILGIRTIFLLPDSAWNPDDTLESVGANLVDDRLEEVVHALVVVLRTLCVANTDRLVGQLNADVTIIFKYGVVLGYTVPNVEQIVLIVCPHLNVARAYARWAHDDIHAMLQRTLGDSPIHAAQILGQSCTRIVYDIGLAATSLSRGS